MEPLLSQLESGLDPEQVVALDSASSLTAAQVAARSRQLATQLRGHGVRRLALLGDNGPDWMIADLACQQAAVCLVPLPTFFSAGQMQHVLAQADPDGVLCAPSSPLTSQLCARVKGVHAAGGTDYQLLILEPAGAEAAVPAGTDKITFTSGSTGDPKGVCLGTPQLLRQAHALAAASGLHKPRHLCLLPLSTLLENVAGIYAPLMAGGEVAIPSLNEIGFEGSSSLDADAFVGVISRYAPHSIILTPQLLFVLVAAAESGWQPPQSLRFVAVGGGRVSPALVVGAHRLGIPAFEGYGLSECASVVSLNTAADCNHASSGRPLPHLQVEIEDGEIVVSGNAMLGYLGEPDSWGRSRIHTGDLGAIDARGFLKIEGRRKNVLVSRYGRNISPEWVESELATVAGLGDCVVFGDDRPYCVALLTPRDDSLSDDAIERSIQAANAVLPDYARVRRWHRLQRPLSSCDGLLTDNGRPRRQAIAARFQAVIDSLYTENTRTIAHEFF